MNDLIQRQDAIDVVGYEIDDGYNAIVDRIKELPSAGQNCILCEYYTEIETDDGIKGKCTRRTGSDLISKEEVLRMIIVAGECEPDLGYTHLYKVIENIPSAEPEKWECKDCTHWDKLDYEAPRQGWCDQFEDWTDADEYCSRCAKMKGGNTE